MFTVSLYILLPSCSLCHFYASMALVEYSSSESDGGSQEKEKSILPPFSCDIEGDTVRFLESNKSSESSGLVRGFTHQHGNWATSVFLPGNCLFRMIFSFKFIAHLYPYWHI